MISTAACLGKPRVLMAQNAGAKKAQHNMLYQKKK